MKAVAEQITSVSRKTDSIWTSPCFTGWLTLAEAAALGAEPTPASLEKRSRFTPCITAEPVKPAKMALEIERLGEDPSEHLGNQPHVHDDDHQGHQHVQSAHDGHQSGGEGDDPLAAAHDAVPGQQRHDAADDPGRPPGE